MDQQATVIVPTAAVRPEIRRAIQSVRDSSRQPLKIIVVVNGPRRDAEICRWLAAQPDVRLESLDQPSLPAAIAHGRACVDTPFFSLLDDDDVYLPGATDQRLAAIGDADIVVSNGYRGGQLAFDALQQVRADPLAQVLRAVWLCSCNALYRSTTPVELFQDTHPKAEWTWLAYRLALGGISIAVLDQPCFRIYDSPQSLSKTPEFFEAYQSLYQRMLSLQPPPHVARLIRHKIAADWHDRSFRALEGGNRKGALQAHVRSLLCGGWRYLSYTRHLF